jgi:excisionase family DNA binding protein
MRTSETTDFLTVEQAARVLGQSRATIYRRIERGQLGALRLGETGPLRIPLSSLLRYARPAARPGGNT